MLIFCKSCNAEYPLKTKARGRRLAHEKMYKMTICPNCGDKNFYKIVERYVPEDELRYYNQSNSE